MCVILRFTSSLWLYYLCTRYCNQYHSINMITEYHSAGYEKNISIVTIRAKPVIPGSSVLDSSVAFMLRVWYFLMWEHCPLLIPFCTLSKNPYKQGAEWQKTCGIGRGGHTNAAKRSILSLTPFFHSFLCSLVTKLVSSSSELPLLEQARQVLSMMPIFLWTLQTKNEVKSQDCKCFSNFPNKYL